MTDLQRELTFSVSKVPVLDIIDPALVKDTKKGISHAIIKDNTQEILSFCSADYELVKNRDIIDAFQKLFDDRDIEITMETQAFNDVKFKISFSLVDFVESIQPNDKVVPEFYILNSYNRTQRYSFGMRVWREVCSNGLSMWVNETQLEMLHTPGAGIAVEESLELINEFLPKFEESLEPYYELAEREMGMGDMDARLKQVAEEVKFPARLIEEAQAQAILEVTKYGFNASDWIIYNSLNFQLNHNADNLLGRKADKLDHKVLDYLMNF